MPDVIDQATSRVYDGDVLMAVGGLVLAGVSLSDWIEAATSSPNSSR